MGVRPRRFGEDDCWGGETMLAFPPMAEDRFDSGCHHCSDLRSLSRSGSSQPSLSLSPARDARGLSSRLGRSLSRVVVIGCSVLSSLPRDDRVSSLRSIADSAASTPCLRTSVGGSGWTSVGADDSITESTSRFLSLVLWPLSDPVALLPFSFSVFPSR